MSKRKNKAKQKRQRIKQLKKIDRNIPKNISDNVKQRHFFACAWCETKLTERHHIIEWSLGGPHSEDNLILLCPNCHTMAHGGDISTDQLIDRKSTHIKADRISGNFQTSLDELKFKMGDIAYINVRHLIAYNYQPILTVYKENQNLFVNATFYDTSGKLIFWMKNNIFWAPSYYESTAGIDKLIILNRNTNENVLKIIKDGEFLKIFCITYLGKYKYNIEPNGIMKISNGIKELISIEKGITKNMHIGFWLSEDIIKYTREGFLKANEEKSDLKGIGIDIIQNSVLINNRIVKKGSIILKR